MGSALYAQYARGYNPLTQMQGIIDFQRGQTALQQERFNLQQSQLQPAYAGLNALLENPNAGWNDVNAALANSARLGGNVSGLVQNATDFAAQGGSPADFIRQYGTARYVPPFEAANLFLPQYAEQRTAMGTYPGQVTGPATPGGPQWSSSGFVARGVTPEQWNQPVPYAWNPQTGAVLTRPYGEVYGGTPGLGGSATGGTGAPQSSVSVPNRQAFTNSFGPYAAMISRATGLPPQFVMAQVAEETNFGSSPAFANNNFGGISANGKPVSYQTPEAGMQAYIGLLNSRYANVPRSGTPQQIGDALATAGYNPAVPGGQTPSYGSRIQAVANDLGLGGPGGGVPGVQQAAYYPPMPGMGGGMGAPGAAAALPPGFVPMYTPGLAGTPPPPGMVEAARTAAAGATGRQQALEAQMNQSINTRATLEGMEADLNNMPTSGVAAGPLGTLKNAVISSGLATPQTVDNLSKGLSAQEQFDKFSSMLNQQLLQGMGGQATDARQELTGAATPSSIHSKLGNLGIISMLEGNISALQVMGRSFRSDMDAGKTSPAQFDAWRDKFTAVQPNGARFDPRVFWIAQMGPQQQQEYADSLTPKDRAQLLKNANYAEKQGWVYENPDHTMGTGY